MNKVRGSKETNIRKRKFARRKTNLASCSDPNCMVIAHTLCPVGTRMNTLPQFAGMNCFEIAHTREASTLFTKIQQNNMEYLRALPLHSICKQLTNAYENDEEVEQTENIAKRSRGRPRYVGLSSPNIDTVSSISDADDNTTITLENSKITKRNITTSKKQTQTTRRPATQQSTTRRPPTLQTTRQAINTQSQRQQRSKRKTR